MGARKIELSEAVRSPGFTPSVRDVPALLRLLATDDDDLVRATERALVRVGDALAHAVVAAASTEPQATPLYRARAARLLGRAPASEEAVRWLVAATRDEDDRARRNAIVALGKAQVLRDEAEAALLEAWRREARLEHRRAVAAALGKVGGAASLEALRGAVTDDDELRKVLDRARIQLDRTSRREEASAIDPSVAPDAPRAIVLRCRRGIERILARELGDAWRARASGDGRVEATLARPLAAAFDARTWTSLAFPLAPRRGAHDDVAAAVIDAMTSDEAHAVLRAWTRGAIRYRLSFEGRGHSRALVWRCAQAIGARRPTLINDPTQSTWEAQVREEGGRVLVELVPRAMEDPRFAYREGDVPAASHPTLAAALARVAGARADDVVWDPFVGSGLELAERARLGPYAAMFGSDLDPRALDVARANLAAAGARATLRVADATTWAPPAPTLIVTNPPMGRRVARGELAPLLDAFVHHAARALADGGRLVWLSPMPARTRERLTEANLKIVFAQEVDMGGFSAELQSAAKI